MTLDLREVRNDLVERVSDTATLTYETLRELPPHDYLLGVGVLLFSIGIIAGANLWLQSWRKKRGYRMILRERRDKIDRLEADILTDGLLEAELRGDISRKEHNEELQRLSDKFGLPDLIPAKRRAQIVKQQIKARLNKAPKGKPPEVPITGRPKPLRQRIGTFANQFWRAKGA